MNVETIDFSAFEAQFSDTAPQIGGVAVMDQIDRPMPDLPPLTLEEIELFAQQLENDELTGADKEFFEENNLTAAHASAEALRAEEANRQKALTFYGVQEQAAIASRLSELSTDEDDEA